MTFYGFKLIVFDCSCEEMCENVLEGNKIIMHSFIYSSPDILYSRIKKAIVSTLSNCDRCKAWYINNWWFEISFTKKTITKTWRRK